MSWIQRYRLQNFLASSFWLPPIVAVSAALSLAPLFRWLDSHTSWTLLNFTPDGARAVLSALASSMFTLMVFVISTLLVVMQIASGQLTPRIIAIIFRLWPIKNSLAGFAFSYAYTLTALGRVENVSVPQLPVAVAVITNLLSLALLFYFAHWTGRELRPITILTRIGDRGRGVIEKVYPCAFATGRIAATTAMPNHGFRPVEYTGDSGVLLVFGMETLRAIAQKAGCTIEVVHRVGDFVSHGDMLFKVYPANALVSDKALRSSIAIGPERTLEQDPAFAIRIMVDVAVKALSPAINDPTSAVLAIDQIHRLLGYIGKRELDSGKCYDPNGKLLLFYPTPDWDDYVSLAISEIRLFGALSLQIARRLRAMLDQLVRDLPAPRAAPLRLQLELLNKAVQRSFEDPEDRASAARSDLQGVGGEELAV